MFQKISESGYKDIEKVITKESMQDACNQAYDRAAGNAGLPPGQGKKTFGVGAQKKWSETL